MTVLPEAVYAIPFEVVLLLIALPLICFWLPLRWLFKQDWPTLRRTYFPISGQVRWEHRVQRQRLLQRIGGEEVTLTTSDERTVHAVWAAAPGAKPQGPVALLLHANAMVLDDMYDWANFYLSNGVSVLMVTFWGMPDPAEDFQQAAPEGQQIHCPSEHTLYADSAAALNYLTQVHRVSAECVLAHGLSMGGAAALSLGMSYPGLQVTVDQTFSSIYEVSVVVGSSILEQVLLPRTPRSCRCLLRALSPCMVRLGSIAVVRMAFKLHGKERIDAASELPDRLDNLRKAAGMTGDLYVITAEHDEMMPAHFAQRLLASRYGRDSAELRSHTLCVPGGHCSFFGEVPELSARYRNHLSRTGFLPC